MAYEGYTTKEIKCYPLAAAGPTIVSSATAWAWPAAWTELVPVNTIASNFVIISFTSLEFPTASLDARHQTLFQIGTGAAASEVAVVSIPVSWYIDSGVGHCSPWVFPIVVPRYVALNTRVAIRVTDEMAVAYTYGGCKIMYIELTYV